MKTFLLGLSMGLSSLAMGQAQNACSPADIPAGYVPVSTSPACAGSTSPLSFNVQRVDTMPPGSVVQACGAPLQRLPAGWATLNWGSVISRNGNYVVYERSIENLNGLPAGTQVSICPDGPVPDGWTVLSQGGAACGVLGGVRFRAYLIRKN